MNNKEAIKYLIPPVATSTEPSAEYLKQKEAYELAIKALEERPTGEWVTDDAGNITCSNCGFSLGSKIVKLLYPFDFPYCPDCGADMKKGEKK